ncbi:ATP:cob(I)alamin adenosyltransferase [Fonticula alba]|uniref:ATP:cob(I)alamin adenosyltransferase n=1 Tax=Fonticula alba TaxID=691883 RepID=A0A058Z9J2_FONAL|nr:ATP:cob(I)alamin adenosyltransferase [Fonticula alba]KCV70781.1 ATP:cob(I)alamin adenosyltransferase [Fonticula alba]|eukprot:XP_009495297.1 ATP:cob(I)alamin adenosyltransferase [Fonticula alba]
MTSLALEHCLIEKNGLAPALIDLQHTLLDAGAAVATPPRASEEAIARVAFDLDHSRTKLLEDAIDELDTQLPPLRQFVLPCGSLAAASLHVARSTARRVERRLVTVLLPPEDSGLDPEHLIATAVTPGLLPFFNRLSDYLFVAGRFASHHAGAPERSHAFQKETDYQRSEPLFSRTSPE